MKTKMPVVVPSEAISEVLRSLPKEIGEKGCLSNKMKMNLLFETMQNAGFAEMASMLLFSFPENENALTVHVGSDDREHDFEIILHKRHKVLPNQESLDREWGRLDSINV